MRGNRHRRAGASRGFDIASKLRPTEFAGCFRRHALLRSTGRFALPARRSGGNLALIGVIIAIIMTGWPHGRIRFVAQRRRGHRVRFGGDEQGEKCESDGGENHSLVNRLLVRAPKKIFVPAPALRLMAKESCRKHGIPAMGSAPPELGKTSTAD